MGWTHLGDTRPRARKSHRCYLCERPIGPGEEHVCRKGVADERFVAMRMHAECEALTRDWDEMDWVCHDAAEFRHWSLGEGAHPGAAVAEAEGGSQP